MNRNRSTLTDLRRLRLPSGLRALAFALALIIGLAVHPASAATVLAAESNCPRQATAPERQPTPLSPSEQLVFSLGVVTAVDRQTVTVGFVDGAPETYRISPNTTIQPQHGDAQTVTDLEVGAEVIVLSHEGDPTALTIVNGGDTGFAEAGPADIRGHEQDDACAPCTDADAP